MQPRRVESSAAAPASFIVLLRSPLLCSPLATGLCLESTLVVRLVDNDDQLHDHSKSVAHPLLASPHRSAAGAMDSDVAFSSEEEDAQQQQQQHYNQQESKREQRDSTAASPAAATEVANGTRPPHRRKQRRSSLDQPTSDDEPSSSSSQSSSSASAASASSPLPHSSYGPSAGQSRSPLGKTSVQANAQLMELFSSMAARYEAQHPFLSLSSFLDCLLSWESLCGLYIAAVCIAGYGYMRLVHMLVEGLLMLVFTAAALALSMWQSYLEHTELVRLLRARMELVLRLPTLAQQTTTDHPPSSTFVRTHRDGRWRLLPANLLVEGDLIEVDEGDPLPGKCKRVEGAGEALSGAEGRERQEMRVVEVPAEVAPGGPKRKADVRERSAIASHSHHVMHPSLSTSPFHSFSHHPAHHVHPFHPHLSHAHSNPSIVHDSHAYPRSYPRVISPGQTSHSSIIVNPPPHPPSPPQPPAPPHTGRLPSSFSDSALSTLSAGERKAEEAEPAAHPMQPSHSVRSMSSLSSYSPAPVSPFPAAYTLSSLPALAASSSHFYIVIDSPLQQQLSFLLRPPDESRSDRPPQPLTAARVQLTKRRVRWFAVCCFLLYCVVTIIRLSVRHGWPPNGSGDERKEWYQALFYHSALLLLPLSFLPSAFYMFLLDAVGNAHLLVLQEAVQARTEQGYGPSSVLGPEGDARERERQEREKRKSGQRRRSDSISSVSSASSSSTDEGDEVAGGEDNDIDDHNTFTFIDSLVLSSSSLFHHTLDILTGRELYITRTVNPLLTLGNITTFCCLDAEGILSENEPSPDHLLLYSGGKATVIDIINDPTSANGIMMEGDWQRHMGVLKPVGLNCALNHSCNMRDSQLCEFVVAGSGDGGGSEEREVSGCLCPLAREIGFDVRWIRQQYYISKVLYNVTLMQQSTHGTVKQRRKGRASTKPGNKPHSTAAATSASSYSPLFDAKVRTMTSIAVQDRLLPDSFHLLTNGDPLLTFRHCSAYWDGDNIKPVDEAIASSFQSILQQWWHQDLHCIAFAYTPIPSLYYALLMDESGREREYIIDTWQEAAGWERKPESVGTDGGSEADGTGGTGTADEMKDERRYGVSDMATMREDAREDDEAALYGVVHDVESGEYDAKAAQQLVDDNEVLLDEATDIVEEATRGARRVRWDSQDVSSAEEEKDDSSHEAELSSASVDSNSANLGPLPPYNVTGAAQPISPTNKATAGVLTSVKPVRILRIPALHRTSFSSSQNGPLGNPRTPTSSSSTIQAGLPTGPPRSSDSPPPAADHESPAAPSTHVDILDPPPAPSQPEPPGPPPTAGGSGSSHDVRISIPSSPSMADTNESQLHAPLLTTTTDGPTLRRLHLHPSSSSSSTTAAMQAATAPRASTPSNLNTYLLSSPYNTAVRSSSTSSNAPPPRPGSTPALLYPTTAPAPSSLSPSFPSNQLQPLLVAALSQPSVSPLPQPASARPGSSQRRARASSLSHSHSQQQLSSLGLPIPAASPASFLPSLQHNDSPILPFTMSSPPASSTPSNDTPPHASRANNTPLAQPTLTTTSAASATTAMPPLSPTSASSVYKQLQHDQLFLGMVAMRDQPKTEVRSLVEHLMAAGIRFVLFSPENERKTQAFGGKIGLFTDFNVFISLADPEGADDKVERRQGKSQLPRGVSAIRAHLERVDNVPLLVSLFTDCRSADVKEMIRIYQENGESVMCMGSSLKVDNAECFMQADIAASLDPIPSRECQHKTYTSNEERDRERQRGGGSSGGGGGGGGGDGVDRESLLGDEEEGDSNYSDSREFAVSSAITSMPCALPLSLTTDLMQFIALICEGRRLSTNFNQVLSFAVQAYLALFILLLFTYIIDTPPLFTGYQLLWLTFLIIPALSLSLFFSTRSADVMTRLADKNIDIASDSSRHITYFIARWLPSMLIYALFFLVFLHSSFDSHLLFDTYYWQSAYSGASLTQVDSYHSVLVDVQAYSQVVYVLALVGHSACMVHRYDSLRRARPWVNWVWCTVAVGCAAAQVVFAAVTWAAAGKVGVSVSWVWYVWLIVWPVWLVTVDELLKAHDRQRREFYHNRARSHFDTVLGMHSPK